MKIGILTFQATNNFGAYLHTIALCKKVTELGFDSEIIDYKSPELIRRETEDFKMSLSPRKMIGYLLFGRLLKQKYRVLQNELREYCILSPEYTPETIKIANDRYDSFLLGSDVVWSLRISDYDYNYFFKFVENGKKINAFSSSVGETDKYRDDKNLPSLLRRFSKIAVREEDAIGWVKDISGMDASYVCDPTMLYSGEEWERIITPQKYSAKYILIYFSDPQGKLERDALQYAQKHNLDVYFIDYGRPRKDMKVVRPKSLSEFLGLIKYSHALFTASYHGMLFGLYFHKELFFYNRSLKSRIDSLARRFGIEDHNGDFFNDSVKPIDYNKVDVKINEFRNYSHNILKEMLLVS